MMKDLRVARTFALSFTSFVFTSVAVIALISVLASCAGRSVSGASTPGLGTPKTGKKTMRAFASEDELKSYFRKLAEERKREAGRSSSNQSANAPAPAATTANGDAVAAIISQSQPGGSTCALLDAQLPHASALNH